MNSIFPSKKILGIASLVLILILSFFFRNTVSKWLTFNDSASPPIADNTHGTEPSVFPSPEESTKSAHTPLPTIVPPAKKTIVYTGRDPMEVRPNLEDVKLFSDEQKKNLYAAIGNHGQAVKDNPDYFDGWLEIGLLKKVIGDYEGARDAWEYAGAIRLLSSVPFANLGELYWHYLHMYAQSEKNFKIAIKNDPKDIGSYRSFSDLYYYSMKEKQSLADDVLLEGIAANPQSGDLFKALGRLYEHLGQYASAMEWWEKALAQDPQSVEIASTIEALKKKVGQ